MTGSELIARTLVSNDVETMPTLKSWEPSRLVSSMMVMLAQASASSPVGIIKVNELGT